jgi:hypothetical protein
VSCPAATACTAIGDLGSAASSGQSAILAAEWDGRTWTLQPVPRPPAVPAGCIRSPAHRPVPVWRRESTTRREPRASQGPAFSSPHPRSGTAAPGNWSRCPTPGSPALGISGRGGLQRRHGMYRGRLVHARHRGRPDDGLAVERDFLDPSGQCDPIRRQRSAGLGVLPGQPGLHRGRRQRNPPAGRTVGRLRLGPHPHPVNRRAQRAVPRAGVWARGRLHSKPARLARQSPSTPIGSVTARRHQFSVGAARLSGLSRTILQAHRCTTAAGPARRSGGYRTSYVSRAVTVGNKAPVLGLASKGAQRVSPGYSRLALADAQQRYDDAIGDFPV